MNKGLKWYQEFTLELLGTFILILLGCGVVAMVNIFQTTPGVPVMGGYTNVTLGWGFAVLMGIYVASASGAHLNPALTISFAVIGKFPMHKMFHYILGQLIGAFLGALVVFVVYYYKWIEFDPNLEHTASVFATFPAVPGFWPGFIDQVVGTGVLMLGILAINDRVNTVGNLGPVVIAFLIMAIGISLGGMHGYAINPARDFSPRLFALVAGFKNTGFENGIWIVPVVGPIVGAIVGGLIYKLIIEKINLSINK